MIEFSNYIHPDWDSYWMKMAYIVAERSKDNRTKIGTVLVKNNISHHDYDDYTWWTKHIVEELVLRYYSQDGTDYMQLKDFMIPRFKKVLEILGPEIKAIHDKAFKIK